MNVSDLAAELHAELTPATPELDRVTGVTHNAAWAEAGFAFVAIRGARVDGHQFIAQAQARGAVCVIGEGLPGDAPCPLPYLKVPSARAALADAAAALAGHPSRALKVIGVTGTDGKTTTSWLARHLLRAAGRQTGLLSTVGYELPDGELRHFPAHFTTPEAPEVQATLERVRAAGGEAVVLEASSHALALDRVRGVDWDVAVWTHLSSEHLDFHGTVEQYFADKARLIERAPVSVLNADDPWTGQLEFMARSHVTYGLETPADWTAGDIEERSTGLHFHVVSPLGEFDARLPMVGRFNVQNALAAMAAAAELGADVLQLQRGLASFQGVPGRMELISAGDGVGADIRVIVDFAHTPPSLEKALSTLRTTTRGRLIVVLGSAGGPRDPGKRAPLGEVASRLADWAVFTEEDHRDTPLEDILNEMTRGAVRDNHEQVPDRREAVRRAVGMARPGDTVLLAGKGPEETLERGHETLPWNEAEEARTALRLRESDQHRSETL